MKRTPVVLAFFFAAVLVGLYVLFSTPTTELFTVTQEQGEPVAPVPSTGPGPLPLKEAPYEITEDAKLFGFDNNRKSPDCCPSAFVSDVGCICLTKEQEALFASRGNNGNA